MGSRVRIRFEGPYDLTDQSAGMRSILEPCRIVSKDNVPFKARHRDSAHHVHFAIEEFTGQPVGNGSGTDITTLAIGGTAILVVVVAIGLLAFRSRKKQIGQFTATLQNVCSLPGRI
jgi:hypothetical protein